jgi:peptidoglycan hydrolase-like protein with peptidoglycan-binding domain
MYRICSAPRAPSWPAGLIAVALALTTAPVALGATGSHDPTLLRSAGWHGREIHQPMPGRTLRIAVGWPRGWSAGAVRPGSGHARADGSRRVRELQRRLRRRGYRPGPVDGRFGPRTRSALVWFQIKHGLPQTGTVDVHTLATIRSRHARAQRAATRAPAVPPAPAAAPTPPAVGPTTAGPTTIALAVLAALLALVCAVALRSTVRRARDAADARAEPRAARPPAAARRPPQPPAAGPARVLGYATVPASHGKPSELEAARAIGAWCERPEPRAAHLPTAARRPPQPPTAAPARVLGYATVPASQAKRSQLEAARAIGSWCERPQGVVRGVIDGTVAVGAAQTAVQVSAGRAVGAGSGVPAARTRSPFAIRQSRGDRR